MTIPHDHHRLPGAFTRLTVIAPPAEALSKEPLNTSKHTELTNHAWSVADLLRGDYRQSDYGKVILPFTVLRLLGHTLPAATGSTSRRSTHL